MAHTASKVRRSADRPGAVAGAGAIGGGHIHWRADDDGIGCFCGERIGAGDEGQLQEGRYAGVWRLVGDAVVDHGLRLLPTERQV